MADLKILQDLVGHHHDDQRCRYHWVAGSDRVVVTIGDSYTYGAGLEPRDGIDHYGARVADDLGHDWINAGCRGGSNSWSINVLSQMTDFLNASYPAGGIIVVTLTENGRDVNEGRSRPFDYISAYQDHPRDLSLFPRVLADIENEWIQRITDVRDRLDQRFSIILGSNFCWHQRCHDVLGNTPGITYLSRSWLECFPGVVEIPRVTTVNQVWSQTLSSILRIVDTELHKRWLLEIAPATSSLFVALESRGEYFCPHDPGHPNAMGHRIWANEILSAI